MGGAIGHGPCEALGSTAGFPLYDSNRAVRPSARSSPGSTCWQRGVRSTNRRSLRRISTNLRIWAQARGALAHVRRRCRAGDGAGGQGGAADHRGMGAHAAVRRPDSQSPSSGCAPAQPGRSALLLRDAPLVGFTAHRACAACRVCHADRPAARLVDEPTAHALGGSLLALRRATAPHISPQRL